MSLADRANDGAPRVRRGVCSITRLLAELDQTEADALRAMLDDPRWPHTKIEEALAEEGHPFGQGQVGIHRRGQCGCDDESG